MASFELKIDTDNAAFQDGDYAAEMRHVFHRILAQIDAKDYLPGKHSNIRDTNGNVVGTFKITE